MAEIIKIKFKNAKNEFLKTLVPIAYTLDPKEAFEVSSEIDKVDYDWTKDKILNTIESIYMNDKIQTLRICIYNDKDELIGDTTLTDVPGKGLLGTSSLDALAVISSEMQKAIFMIFTNIKNEMSDIYLRCKTSGLTISGMTSSLASSGETSTAGKTVPKDEELESLCESISANTKAEIVKPKETLDEYVCNDLLKEELNEIKEFFEHSGTYKAVGVEIPKGILFKGPWGTGKTYAARCIAGSVDCYFMVCTASALQGQYIGSGAENIRNVFKSAKFLAEKSKKGVIIFIDELDSLGDRQNRGGSASGEEDRTLNQLLAEMSGFTDSENIMVLAATNFPERLDSALMRSGRFGRQITIDYPDDEQRKAMVSYYFNKIKIPLEKTLTYEDIAALTKGLTPADIKEIANEAGILSIRQSKTEIILDNVNEAINKVITKNIRHPDKSTEELNLVTAHECGHVLAEVIYNNTIPIKVTNYAYGDAGGFTQSAEVLTGILPKHRFINEIKMLLAGRAAEQVICGYITNGASNDLEKAKNLVYSYFKYYNFEKYEVKELDQLVINKLDELYNEVVEDFKQTENKKVLVNLIDALFSKRVLYSTNIVGIVSPIRKVTF